ncbi:hypothetical protein MHB63_06535 [Bacillus sp. FSL H8-0547]
MQWFWFFLAKFISQYSIFPNKEEVFFYLFWLCVVLSVLSTVYTIPFIYKRSQKIQYSLVIIVLQIIFGYFPLLLMLVHLGTAESGLSIDENTLIDFTEIIILIGMLVFLVTIIRLAILLKKGQYRQGTKKDRLRKKYEKADYLPSVILGSMGILFFLRFLFANIQTGFSLETIVGVLGILLFFTMMFILPEQLLIMYCKIRFKSFNFNERGYLYAEAEEKGGKTNEN